ncbi:hypothetical protein, partial [Pseudomonas hunanensis]|uniref:hypothetical protein n=1 Tax=Pseudomonas hunanensis TaxID=1247546 RepID=UPI00286CCDA7
MPEKARWPLGQGAFLWVVTEGWLGLAWELWAYPIDVVAFRAPSALTAGHFFSWKKVTKNRLLLHPALRC